MKADGEVGAEIQRRMLQVAERCMALLDEILEPVPPEVEGEIAELRASGVSEGRIALLYPKNLDDYMDGIQAVLSVEGLAAFTRLSEDLEQFSTARLRLRQEVLPPLYDAVGNSRVVGSRLVGTVALLRLLLGSPLDTVLEAPEEDSEAIERRLLRLEDFLLDLRHLQRLDAEPSGRRRALIRLGYQLTRLRRGQELGEPRQAESHATPSNIRSKLNVRPRTPSREKS